MINQKIKIKTALLCAVLAFSACNNDLSETNEKVSETKELKASSSSYASLATTNKLLLVGGNGGLSVPNSNTQNRTGNFEVPVFQSKETQNRSSNDVQIYALAEQEDGKVIVGGNFGYINGNKANSIARINSDGSIDSTFMKGKNGFNGEVYHIEILDDNTILVGGYFNKIDDEDISKGLVRLNIDGTIHTVYNELDVYDNLVVNDLELVGNKIFLSGSFVHENNGEYIERALLLVDQAGNLDQVFNEKVSGIKGTGYKIVKKNDDLILAGALDKPLSNILKIGLNGEIDSTSDLNSIEGLIFDIEYKNDTLIIAGDFIFENNNTIHRGLALYDGNQLSKVSELDVEADIYGINIFDNKLILLGEGNYTVSGKKYQGSIMLDEKVIK